MLFKLTCLKQKIKGKETKLRTKEIHTPNLQYKMLKYLIYNKIQWI